MPEEISAQVLLQLWASQVSKKHPEGLIPIHWFVQSRELAKFEAMPFAFGHFRGKYKALRLPQYEVYCQLAVLRDADLVGGEKPGNRVYYRVSPDLTPLAAALLEALRANLSNRVSAKGQGAPEGAFDPSQGGALRRRT